MEQEIPQSKTRECQKEKQELDQQESKRICIPIDQETCNQIIDNKEFFRACVDGYVEKHPEIFPRTLADSGNRNKNLGISVKFSTLQSSGRAKL